MRGHENICSPRVYSTTATGLTDADGVKTVAAAPIALTTYSGAALNGAVQTAGFNFPRFVTITTAVNAATYNTTDAILITGTRSGVVTTATVTPTNAAGGETLTTTTPFDTVTSVRVPAQLQAAGGISIGVIDMGCRCEVNAGALGGEIPYREVKVNGAGDLLVRFYDGTTETIPCLAGDRESILVHRIYGTSTATPIVVYE